MNLLKAFEYAKQYLPEISIDDKIMKGNPCIKGTRIPIWCIINEIANNYYPLKLISYPDLNTMQIVEALIFAEKVLKAYNHEKT